MSGKSEILSLKLELAQVREILAWTDLSSLPNDYPTAMMAADRMNRIQQLTLDGLAQIGRWEQAEAEIERLREALVYGGTERQPDHYGETYRTAIAKLEEK